MKFKNKVNKLVLTSIFTAAAIGFSAITPTVVLGHGWIVNDRAHLSSSGGGNLNSNMGNVQWEPQSAGEVFNARAVERGIISLNDAVSANAGSLGGFAQMREFGYNRFHRVPMTPGFNQIQWWFTAPHRTSSIVYYISLPGFNPNAPLDYSDFEYMASFNYGGYAPARPNELHTHNIHVPTDRVGAHAIVVAWHIADNDVTWYRVKDIYVTADGTVTAPQPVPTQPETQPTIPTPELDGGNNGGGHHGNPNAWRSHFTYTQGEQVEHVGFVWEAQWWTRGEEPGTTGQWGVWRQVGVVSETAPTKPLPTPEVAEPEITVPEVDLPEETPEIEGVKPFSNTFGTLYTAGQLVSFNGNVYRARVTFVFWGDSSWTPSSNSTLWERV